MTTGAPRLVSIQILTWNRRTELARCLDSVLAQTYPRCEIVVVDSASTDDTADFVRTQYPQVKLYRLEANLGCPSGRNLGATYCTGEYLYFLDDDGWLAPDAIARAVARAESDPDIAVVMSRIHEYADGVVVRKRPLGLEQPVYLVPFSGGCSLVRRAVLDATYLYPDDFFRSAEESDLCLRLLGLGSLVFLEPASIMYHAPSTSGRNNKSAFYLGLRNTNKTGLRLWPFPWVLLRPLVNFGHACLGMLVYRDVTLPARLVWDWLKDLLALSGRRTPVSADAFRLFRALQSHPTSKKPVRPAHRGCVPQQTKG